MRITELFYPQIRVRIGQYQFDQGVEIEVCSAKKTYCDWAKIRFTGAFNPKLPRFERGTPAVIELGYHDVFDEVFVGQVFTMLGAGSEDNEILLKDDAMLLEQTEVTGTFLDSTPQEMISYFLGQAGIRQAVLSDQYYTIRSRVPIVRVNVIRAIEMVHAAWGITQPFFFFDRVFYWGTKPRQTKIYQFEYGVNILHLKRTGGLWELETVSAPFVRHSQSINIVHPQVSGTFEVSKVVFITNDAGFIRTYIYF